MLPSKRPKRSTRWGRQVDVPSARLAQSVEHGTLNPRVVGSSPTLGEVFCHQSLKSTQNAGKATYDHVELIARKCERGYSSVAEHSTADREVTGSTPVVPW